MADMREYKDVIKTAVARERQADENWSWRISSITKKTASIGWGYLDYIGEKAFFTVEIEDTDVDGNITDEPAVIGTIPNGSKVYRFVGPHHWDDCTTVEAAIASAIHSMAVSAHNTY